MTCQTVQNHILALPDPRQVSGVLREHLTGCPGCTAWWHRTARLEHLLERLPVPAAPTCKKTAFLNSLTAAEPRTRNIPATERRSAFASGWARSSTKALAGLAAAVLIAVGGWLVFRPGSPTVAKAPPAPRHPLLEKVVQRDLALAQAKAPEQRLEILGDLADDISAEARGLARVATADELRDLSGMFGKVVDGGIVPQAEKIAGMPALSPDQKRSLFNRLAAQLDQAGREATAAAPTAPPHAQSVLRTISDKARDGQAKLRAFQTRGGA